MTVRELKIPHFTDGTIQCRGVNLFKLPDSPEEELRNDIDVVNIVSL